jgi:lipopolysaccharide export system permease protein
MTLLGRYLFKELVIFFCATLAAILLVYLCVEFLQKADDFIRAKATILQVGKYFLYSAPSMATEAVPVAALIATLLSLGNLSRHSEIIAMRAGGLSFGKILAPLLVAGAAIAVLGFVNNEFVMPFYSAKANAIRYVEIGKKQQVVVFQQRQLWLRGPENSVANIELVSPERDTLFGLNIYKLNPDFTVRERITAKRLVWEGDAWRLRESTKYIIGSNGVVAGTADGEAYNVVDAPADLGMIVKKSEEMNFRELWDYVRKLRSSGYNAARYEVDLQHKLAFPLSSLLMVMIAVPFSIHRVRSGGAGRGIAIAVAIAFAYWALMSIGTALGRSGALPPIAAAWLSNTIVASTAAYSLVRMHREG